MEICRYQTDQKQIWDNFLDVAKNGHFIFKRDYMEYHSDRFKDHSLLLFDRKNRLLSVFPANQKSESLISHQALTWGGFLTDKKMRMPIMMDMIKALKNYAAKAGFKEIIYKAIPFIYHQMPASEDIYALHRMGADFHQCDVSSAIDYTFRIKFSTLRKRGIKKAINAAITVIESFDLASFFNIVNTVLLKHRTTAVHTVKEMALLKSRFPENIRLFSAYNREKMVAGVLIFETRTVAHTQYIACLPDHQPTGALDLLLDFLINQQFVNKRYFNFGTSTENKGKHLNKGLIDQKEGFGARSIVYNSFKIKL